MQENFLVYGPNYLRQVNERNTNNSLFIYIVGVKTKISVYPAHPFSNSAWSPATSRSYKEYPPLLTKLVSLFICSILLWCLFYLLLHLLASYSPGLEATSFRPSLVIRHHNGNLAWNQSKVLAPDYCMGILCILVWAGGGPGLWHRV